MLPCQEETEDDDNNDNGDNKKKCFFEKTEYRHSTLLKAFKSLKRCERQCKEKKKKRRSKEKPAVT